LISIVEAAGWPIWPLIFCSILAMALIAERLMQLRIEKISPPGLLQRVTQQVNERFPSNKEIEALAAGSLQGELFAHALRQYQANPQMELVSLRASVEPHGRELAQQLERFLPALGTIASAAPLLGLLGTVIGMIEIFGSQSPGAGNPAQLAHGISVALYNTAFGLIVAIPSLAFWRYFRHSIDEMVVLMETQTDGLIKHLCHAKPRS
jgi:biopolymer transport protein ExbB